MFAVILSSSTLTVKFVKELFLNMKLFMTSSPGGSVCVDGKWAAAPFDRSNGFLDRLRSVCPSGTKCLILSSDPDRTEMNDEMKGFLTKAFAQSGILVEKTDICDRRNLNAADRLKSYGILILSGGHVPTQNAFFQKIGLKGLLKNYEGVVIGISAGTMNCAGTVYAQPEEPGEAEDPDYQRYIPGLGLTSINVLPHFQHVWDGELDGLRMMEDICLPDSRIRPFYGLPDGSWLYRENGRTTLYGEAWLLKDGICTKVCENGKSLEVSDER